MEREWKVYRLGEIAEIGSSKRIKMADYVNKGIPFYRSKEIIEKHKGNDISTELFIAEKQFKAIKEKFGAPTTGDILLTSVGTLGVPYQVTATDCFYFKDGNLTWFRNFKSFVNSRYVYFWLTSSIAKNKINEVTIGSTQQALTIVALKAITISLPPLSIQNAIVNHIDSISEKITLNRQINQTLEQMAQALFKSWFVGFDPVVDNALDAGFFEQNSDLPVELLRRAEQRKIVREQPDFKPLPAETRQLFPAAFEECEEPSLGLYGWVPKGWAGSSVSEAITVNPKVKLAKGEMAAFVDMKSLPTTGYSIEDVDRKAFSGGAKFKQHDVLFARITPCLQNGKTGFVDFLSDNENGFGSTEFIVLRGNEFVDYTYVACLARHESFRQHAMQSMVGSSGRQRVQNSCFDDFFIVIPPQNIMNKFAGIVSTSFKKLKTNSDEIISLVNVRDTLLPKLISGELRLNDDGTLASGNTDC
ncbi:MAG: restriction endonuclease subunit S [Plesiomonas sp.]|uniref:restriction endonuclease subunit S n=1 Tax=Plesiomonas sp. TaxID=2486279 RepID=UPI003F3B520A